MSPDNPLTARAQALGIKLVERTHIPSSRRAHAATEFARLCGRLEPFHHAVLERYWSREEDISTIESLRGAATDAGVDPVAMENELDSPQLRAQVQLGIDAALDLGIHAVPTFIVGDRFVIQGAQEGAVFRQAFERLQPP